ncbi:MULTISPECIES: phage tail tape measure protein [unclassified Gilliamella]|uniref:phage tail tape measure protein n=1 Tax=unclassified Gilliamella TaxID=2685620 RepID=UPI00226A469C|nr:MULTISPECIES: phage tail tape measure protein [unclassified Gilliamella]MCX8574626.1 phage tail tape measure protein [Gilliamella sp. B3831]MCX8577020.1 phage tail tape measure protein [Gilliamella sp. B3815]MCX8590350.1 phage tail tape measure protein [Gilliamella sp. B3812]MCX8603958.1 phage tail tape measure protein [Gilliamella sp. B3823]MCX8605689.1 phage tail tape measure protein [Gilliamella sp. B3825]
MSKTTTLSLKVETGNLDKEIKRINELDVKLKITDKSLRTLNTSKLMHNNISKRQLESLYNQIGVYNKLLGIIHPVNKALDNLLYVQQQLSDNNGNGFIDAHAFQVFNSIIESSKYQLIGIIESQETFANTSEKMSAALSQISNQIKQMSAQANVKKNPLMTLAEHGIEIGELFGPVGKAIGTIVEVGAVVGKDLFDYFDNAVSATDSLRESQEKLYSIVKLNKDGTVSFTEEMKELANINPKFATAFIQTSKRLSEKSIESSKGVFEEILKESKINFNIITHGLDYIRTHPNGIEIPEKIDDFWESKEQYNQAMGNVHEQIFSLVKSSTEQLAKTWNITNEEAKLFLNKLLEIKNASNSFEFEAKLNDLGAYFGDISSIAGKGNDNLDNFIIKFKEIITKVTNSTKILKSSNDLNGNPQGDKGNRNKINTLFSSKNSAPSLLKTSQRDEKNLQIQLESLKEQNATIGAITAERKKYFDLQAQINILEQENNKSRLTAEERHLLANKASLLTQYEKNAAISEEINGRIKAQQILQNITHNSTQLQNEIADKKATFGMTSSQSSRYQSRINLERNKEQDLDPSNNLSQENIITITQNYLEAAQLLEESFVQEDLQKGDWIAGLTTGLKEFAETSQDVFSVAKDFAQNSIGSMSQMMTTLVTTGKANFQEFAKTILVNLIEIINKLILAQIIQSALTSFGGGGKATGGLQQAYTGGEILGYASGGSVGYALEPGGFTGRGNKYQPAGIVHKGEFVFTKEATQRLGVDYLYSLMNDSHKGYDSSGYVHTSISAPIALAQRTTPSSNAITVNPNIVLNMSSENSTSTHGNNTDPKQVQYQVDAVIRRQMNEMFKKSVSPGGELYNVMYAMK